MLRKAAFCKQGDGLSYTIRLPTAGRQPSKGYFDGQFQCFSLTLFK